MKTLVFVLMLICIGTESMPQNTVFKGKIVVLNNDEVDGGVVIFPLKKDTLKIGIDGIAKVDLSDITNRVFYMRWSGWNTQIFRFDQAVCDTNIVVAKAPDSSYYYSFQRKKLCPVGLHTNYLIPVMYGLPKKSTMRKAEKGKVFLAGCIVFDVYSKYYCRKHQFSF